MRLIERDAHLRQLAGLLNDCLAGTGQVVVLDGPIASGKTALLHNFVERAANSAVVCLNAAAARLERELPFGVVDQLFHSIDLPADRREQVARLTKKATEKIAATGSGIEPTERDLVSVFHELCRVLLDLSAHAPILVTVDDIRHADVPSLHCLLHLVRRLGSARVLVVLTDDMDLPGGHPLFRAELIRQPHFHQIRLGPLSPPGVGQMLAEQVAAETARRLAPGFVETSGGNPLLLHALVADHRLTGDVRAPGYGRALLTCLHRGEPIMLQVARGLAVLGEDASPAELGELIDADVETVNRAVDSMTAAGLLGGGCYRHPIARSAVLDDMSPRDRADSHYRAAQILSDRGTPAMTIAEHLVQAADHGEPWAVDVLVKAADQSVIADQMNQAVEYLKLARQGCANEQDRIAIQARIAQAEWPIDPAAAGRHLAPLAAAATRADTLDRPDRIALIRQLLWDGRTADAQRVLDRLRGSVDRAEGGAAAVLQDLEQWLTCSYPSLARSSLVPGAGHSATPPDHQNPPANPDVDPWLRSTAVLAGALAGDQGHTAVGTAHHVLQNLHLGRTTSWAGESGLLALLVLISADRLDMAASLCDRLRADAATRGAPTWQALFAGTRAEIAVRQGDFQLAVRAAQEAFTHLTPKAWGVAIGLPLGSLILAATRMGNYTDAARYLAEPVPDAMFHSRYGLHYLYARGHYHLATDLHRAALADFMACDEFMRQWGHDVAGVVPSRIGAAEVLLRLGDREQARRLVHEQLTRSTGERARTRALAQRLLADISPPSRRPQLLTEALELFEGCGDRFEQARTLAELSRAHHALGGKRRARMVLRRALHMATMCNANPRCQELSIPGDPGDLGGGGPEQDGSARVASLTDSERRVASLAVVGHTNNEIAGKLFVTPSTVEQHLTRVYRKLDVKGRAELPAELGGEVAKMARLRRAA